MVLLISRDLYWLEQKYSDSLKATESNAPIPTNFCRGYFPAFFQKVKGEQTPPRPLIWISRKLVYNIYRICFQSYASIKFEGMAHNDTTVNIFWCKGPNGTTLSTHNHGNILWKQSYNWHISTLIHNGIFTFWLISPELQGISGKIHFCSNPWKLSSLTCPFQPLNSPTIFKKLKVKQTPPRLFIQFSRNLAHVIQRPCWPKVIFIFFYYSNRFKVNQQIWRCGP